MDSVFIVLFNTLHKISSPRQNYLQSFHLLYLNCKPHLTPFQLFISLLEGKKLSLDAQETNNCEVQTIEPLRRLFKLLRIYHICKITYIEHQK